MAQDRIDRLARWSVRRSSRREVIQGAAAAGLVYALLPSRLPRASAQSPECSVCDDVYRSCFDQEMQRLGNGYDLCVQGGPGGGPKGIDLHDAPGGIGKLEDGSFGVEMACLVKFIRDQLRAADGCRAKERECRALNPCCGGSPCPPPDAPPATRDHWSCQNDKCVCGNDAVLCCGDAVYSRAELMEGAECCSGSPCPPPGAPPDSQGYWYCRLGRCTCAIGPPYGPCPAE